MKIIYSSPHSLSSLTFLPSESHLTILSSIGTSVPTDFMVPAAGESLMNKKVFLQENQSYLAQRDCCPFLACPVSSSGFGPWETRDNSTLRQLKQKCILAVKMTCIYPKISHHVKLSELRTIPTSIPGGNRICTVRERLFGCTYSLKDFTSHV